MQPGGLETATMPAAAEQRETVVASAGMLRLVSQRSTMHVLTSALHLLAGLVWAAGLLAASSGATTPAPWARAAGPVLLATGLLLAFGSIRLDETKALVGLYGLMVALALAAFAAAIAVARARRPLSWLVGAFALLSLLMALMAHRPG